jgi:hypothetical protein
VQSSSADSSQDGTTDLYGGSYDVDAMIAVAERDEKRTIALEAKRVVDSARAIRKRMAPEPTRADASASHPPVKKRKTSPSSETSVKAVM